MGKYDDFFDGVRSYINLLKDGRLSAIDAITKYCDIFRDKDFDVEIKQRYGLIQLICIKGILFSIDAMNLYGEDLITSDNVIEMLDGILKTRKIK